jgi:hypothetical protein
VKAYDVVGYAIEGAFYCTEHAQVDEGDTDCGHATPVFAGDEGADDMTCDGCVADAVAARQPRYLDETRVTALRETPIPRHKGRRDGYGTLVPGAFMLQIDGKRWYRVRTTCWSNAGTDFVRIDGHQHILPTGWLIRWGQHELAQARLRGMGAAV